MSMRERKKIQKLSWEVGRESWVLFFVWATVTSSSWAAGGIENPVKVQAVSPTQRALTFSFDRKQVLALAERPGARSYVAQSFAATGSVSYTVSRQSPVTVTLDAPLADVADTAGGLPQLVVAKPSAWSAANGVLVKQLAVMRGEGFASRFLRLQTKNL